MDTKFLRLVPRLRQRVNEYIKDGVIDLYAISMEAMKGYVIINAESKEEVQKIIDNFPMSKYFTADIQEVFAIDSKEYRIPEINLN